MRSLVVVTVILAGAGPAAAEGLLSMRGGYFKEKSTLVEQPMLDLEMDAGRRGILDAHVLVDGITSASSATGAPNEFSERRYEVGLGYTWDLRGARAGGRVQYSIERDYTSAVVSVHGDKDLAEKNALVRVALGAGRETVTNGVAVDQGGLGTPRQSEDLTRWFASVSLSQILTPELVAGLTYDLMFNEGYQANIYRLVFGGMTPAPERVPNDRVRHAVFVNLRGFFCPTGTTAVVGYRFYVDDWGIQAHTPEVRLIQDIVDGLELRVRYRAHVQTQADFYQDVYSQAQIDNDPFITDDEKLSSMHTQTIGGRLSMALGLLGIGGRWGAARLELQADYYQQSTAFGNAFIGQLGLDVPIL
jgi:hypothetical protein